ncbi:hypothetical protein FQA39_LY14981 [Lamprigera yunnana]|nr:hypothetical protein FQA39_LY14981 [Lamprigera yunnana]
MLERESEKRNLVIQEVEDEEGENPEVTKIKVQDIIRKMGAAGDLTSTKIWISDDFTRKVQAERKKLFPYLKEAPQKEKKAFLKYDKLVINGKELCSKNLAKLKQEDTNSAKRTMSDRTPEKHDFEERLKTLNKMNKNDGKISTI